MRHKLIAMMLTVCLLVGVLPAALVSAADPNLTYNSAGGYYEISSVDDWNTLAAYVANGNSCAGMTFKLTDDIGAVTRPIGAHGKKTTYAFDGEFDGNGKTLTVDLKSSDSWYTEDHKYCSPFAYTKNAVIENLHVDGTIESSGQHMAGLVGHAEGTITVSKCRISVALTSTHHVNGNGNVNTNKAEKAGGVIGYAAGSATIADTVFDGKLLGEDFSFSGGFIGENHGSATIADCSFIPSEIAASVHADHADTFVPTNNGSCTYEGVNVYASELGATAASTDPSVKKGYHVTVAGDIENGAVSVSSDSLHIEGETVTLTVVPAEGYELESITGTDGSDMAVEVTGSDGEYTFTMPASDVIISAVFTETPVITEPEFVEANMSLSGQIGITFNMYLPEIEGVNYDYSYMTFGNSEKDSSIYEEGKHWFENENEEYLGESRLYGFTCYIRSIQMADTIYATFHWPEGDPVNDPENVVYHTISIEYSAERYFEDFDAYNESNPGLFDQKTIDLVHATADYGHYVQLYLQSIRDWNFGTDYTRQNTYYTDSYDFDAIASDLQEKGIEGIVRPAASDEISKVTYSLLLESTTGIKVYYKMNPEYTGGFQVTSVNGGAFTYGVDEIGRNYVEIPNIFAQNLDRKYTIVSATDSGNTTVEVSAMSYVVDALAAYNDTNDSSKLNRNAVAAIYHLWTAAEAYVAND